eukprot:1564818-Pyramimonas_sp.AAC.1
MSAALGLKGTQSRGTMSAASGLRFGHVGQFGSNHQAQAWERELSKHWRGGAGASLQRVSGVACHYDGH